MQKNACLYRHKKFRRLGPEIGPSFHSRNSSSSTDSTVFMLFMDFWSRSTSGTAINIVEISDSMFLGKKIPVLGTLVLLLHSKSEHMFSNRFQHNAVIPLQYSHDLSDSGLLHFNISESLITKKIHIQSYRLCRELMHFQQQYSNIWGTAVIYQFCLIQKHKNLHTCTGSLLPHLHSCLQEQIILILLVTYETLYTFTVKQERGSSIEEATFHVPDWGIISINSNQKK